MSGLVSLLTDWGVRPQDLLDILIVAYIIYRGLLLIQGTLAARMVISVVFLFLLMHLAESRWLELHTLSWSLRHFWSIALLSMMILFHPEIRRALARFSQNRFWWQRVGTQDEQLIDELVKAVTALASRETGALIVLERETGLQPIRELGVQIDARVSSELLRALFYPNSPMHDGAVIIREFRIASAACFLPLTKNPDLSTHFGTRHRAAIGVTEETDAIAVVVSEETGRVSVAHLGQIETLDEPGQLRERLRSLIRGRG
jgi:diadenylate cyclase